MSPDVAAAALYVRERLHGELAVTLTYHNPGHTIDDVVPAATRLAAQEGVDGRALELLLTGAWFHDVGFVERADGHELIGVGYAEAALPAFGYDADDLAVIRGLILATRLPQAPATLPEAILCDADLDVLGRDDFFDRNAALRAELAAAGAASSDHEWWNAQSDFVAAHTYFTPSARRARDAGKLRNLARLRQLAAAR